MGLLTGALFIGWRRARGRERRLERAYAAQNEELQELMAAVFCCQLWLKTERVTSGEERCSEGTCTFPDVQRADGFAARSMINAVTALKL
jgi:hypothetical protein